MVERFHGILRACVRASRERLGSVLAKARRGGRPLAARRRHPPTLAVLPPGTGEAPPGADCIYAPTSSVQALDADALENARLGLAHREYDFLLFSRSLLELPRIVAPLERRQSTVFTRGAAEVFLGSLEPSRCLRGRLVRVPGLQDGSPSTDLTQLLPGARPAAESGEILWRPGETKKSPAWDCSEIAFSAVAPKTKPRVFVWPALWAVGGVERNTIEIMKQLQGRYEFVVVTTERLTESLGSLHHQLKGLAAATYDLAEIGFPFDYLSMMATLKRSWDPDVVWICNGSVWQCDHAPALRRLYEDTPIVDQEVYDTRVGWIRRYHEPGIQSFDRFIAINRRIRETFVGPLGMDPTRIDVIYPAFDGQRFRLRAHSPDVSAALKASLGLVQDWPLYLFVGRMTAQKRPLDFVELALRLTSGGLEASFLMLGDGDLAVAVDRKIAYGPSGRLRRLAFTDEVPEILALADGLIITSEYEGVPVAMLEGLAMGVPVLSTDVGDVRLLVEEYGVGAIVPRIGDVKALEAAFREWLARLPQYRRAARAAAPRVAARFSAEQLATEYEQAWRRAHLSRRGLDLGAGLRG
jgi:glycosyltransferase involved in cell wall biosynthesis